MAVITQDMLYFMSVGVSPSTTPETSFEVRLQLSAIPRTRSDDGTRCRNYACKTISKPIRPPTVVLLRVHKRQTRPPREQPWVFPRSSCQWPFQTATATAQRVLPPSYHPSTSSSPSTPWVKGSSAYPPNRSTAISRTRSVSPPSSLSSVVHFSRTHIFPSPVRCCAVQPRLRKYKVFAVHTLTDHPPSIHKQELRHLAYAAGNKTAPPSVLVSSRNSPPPYYANDSRATAYMTATIDSGPPEYFMSITASPTKSYNKQSFEVCIRPPSSRPDETD